MIVVSHVYQQLGFVGFVRVGNNDLFFFRKNERFFSLFLAAGCKPLGYYFRSGDEILSLVVVFLPYA